MNVNDDEEAGVFLLNSHSRHEIVWQETVADGVVDFEANEKFIVIVCHPSSSCLFFFLISSCRALLIRQHYMFDPQLLSNQ